MPPFNFHSILFLYSDTNWLLCISDLCLSFVPETWGIAISPCPSWVWLWTCGIWPQYNLQTWYDSKIPGTCSYYWIFKPISSQSSLMPSNLMRLYDSHNGYFWNSAFSIFGTMGPSHIGASNSFSGSYWRNTELVCGSVFAIFSIFPLRHKLLCFSFTNDYSIRKFPVLKISFLHCKKYACTKCKILVWFWTVINCKVVTV